MSTVLVNVAEQLLYLYQDRKPIKKYPISTAANGLGERSGSYQTPRGWHVICEKIGQNHAAGTVFQSRVATGEIYSPDLGRQFPDRDWIVSRIMRLKGLEHGLNRGADRDSYERMIYIHGGASDRPVGVPSSRGCIRMDPDAVIMLFEHIKCGDRVLIHNDLKPLYNGPFLDENR